MASTACCRPRATLLARRQIFMLAPRASPQVANRGLCAVAQAESLRYKLLGGLAVRRACYGVLRFVMESGAKGCEVIVSGKLRAQVNMRARGRQRWPTAVPA